MKIPLNKAVIPNKEALAARFQDVLNSGILTNNGPLVKQLESALCRYTSSKFCLTSSSGTTALEVAINALGLKGEILTTPFSFIASSSSILWQNCTPVFIDIHPNTLCIDPDLIESKITSKTCAILPVHTFGNPCDIETIENIASKYGLKTIYDGAHALGMKYNGHSIFKFGDVSVTSLHAYKIVNAAEGGAIFTQSEAIRNAIFEVRYFGKNRRNEEVRIGTNAKMSELHAAIGLNSLDNVVNEIRSRQMIGNKYLEAISESKEIETPNFLKNEDHNFSYFPIQLKSMEKAEAFIDVAAKEGIEARRYFFPSLNELPFMHANIDTPVASAVSKRIVCIPIYSSLIENDMQNIVSFLQNVSLS